MKFMRTAIAVCLLDLASVDAERLESGEDMPLMQFAHQSAVQEEARSWAHSFWGSAAAAELAEVRKDVKEELGQVVVETRAAVERAEREARAEEQVAALAALTQLDLATHELAEQTEEMRTSPAFHRAEEQVAALNASLAEGVAAVERSAQEDVATARKLAAEKLQVAERIAAERLMEAEENLRNASASRLATQNATLTGEPPEYAEEVRSYAETKGKDATAAVKESVARVTQATVARAAHVLDVAHATEDKVKEKVHAVKEKLHTAKDLNVTKEVLAAEDKVKGGMRVANDQFKKYLGNEVVDSVEAAGEAYGVFVKRELEAAKVVSEAALRSQAAERVQAEVEAATAKASEALARRRAAEVQEEAWSSFSREELEALLRMVQMYPAEMGLAQSADFQMLQNKSVHGLREVSAGTQLVMTEFRELIVREKERLAPRERMELEELRTDRAPSDKPREVEMSPRLRGDLQRFMRLLGIRGDAPDGTLAQEDVSVLAGLLSSETERFPTFWRRQHLQNVNITLGSE